jgi:S1-C subfamily serine protease
VVRCSTGRGTSLCGSEPELPRECVLITNRHVLAGASAVQVSTWDGQSLDASSAAVGTVGDLGVAVVRGHLPTVGHFTEPSKPGDAITVVGDPNARVLTLAEGPSSTSLTEPGSESPAR